MGKALVVKTAEVMKLEESSAPLISRFTEIKAQLPNLKTSVLAQLASGISTLSKTGTDLFESAKKELRARVERGDEAFVQEQTPAGKAQYVIEASDTRRVVVQERESMKMREGAYEWLQKKDSTLCKECTVLEIAEVDAVKLHKAVKATRDIANRKPNVGETSQGLALRLADMLEGAVQFRHRILPDAVSQAIKDKRLTAAQVSKYLFELTTTFAVTFEDIKDEDSEVVTRKRK